MGKAIVYYSYSSILVVNESKAILWLSELVRTIFAAVYSNIITTCIELRDWFEDRDSYHDMVNTHDYGTKIILMNRLHNR